MNFIRFRKSKKWQFVWKNFHPSTESLEFRNNFVAKKNFQVGKKNFQVDKKNFQVDKK